MQESTDERWLPVVGHEGYEVSDHGRVRSLTRTVICKNGRLMRVRGRMLKPQRRTGGHMWVEFGRDSRSVHSLVLEAFVRPRPTGMVACHWDDNPSNNHVSNLRWGTTSDNMRDRIRNGKHQQSNRTHCRRRHILAAPNLVPSLRHLRRRSCLACSRAYSVVQKARKNGTHVDLQAVSDAYYADIISGRSVGPLQRGPKSRRTAGSHQVGRPH